MTRKLPPLNALKAFEASARLGSFVLAAEELNVTAGAVSQQILKLEDFFGRQLFVRRNNQLLLTDLGRSMKAESTDIVDRLLAMTERLLEDGVRSMLIISVLPSVGVRWLNRRLPNFLLANPDVRVDIRLEEDPVDFYRNRIDVRISYGEHLYPDFITVPFRRDRVTVMCTESMLESGELRHEDPASIKDNDLIHVAWRTGFSAYPTWESWFTAAACARRPRQELGHTVDTSSLAIDIAGSGTAIALGQYMLAEDDLRGAQLVTPFSTSIPLQYNYCAVHSPDNSRNQTVQKFVTWLRSLPASYQ
jgi:LysR family glycine cleavage system transcriptional activator